MLAYDPRSPQTEEEAGDAIQYSPLGQLLDFIYPGATRVLGLYEQVPYSESRYLQEQYQPHLQTAPTAPGETPAPQAKPQVRPQAQRPQNVPIASHENLGRKTNRSMTTPALTGEPERVGTDFEDKNYAWQGRAGEGATPQVAGAPEQDVTSLLPKDLGEGTDYVTELENLLNEFDPSKDTLPTCAYGPTGTVDTLGSFAQNLAYSFAGYDPMKMRLMREQEAKQRQSEMQDRYVAQRRYQMEAKAKVLEARHEVDLQKRSDALAGLQSVANLYPDVRKNPEFLRSLGKIYKLDMNGVNSLISNNTDENGKLTLFKTPQDLAREEKEQSRREQREAMTAAGIPQEQQDLMIAGVNTGNMYASEENLLNARLTNARVNMRHPDPTVRAKAAQEYKDAEEALLSLQSRKAKEKSKEIQLMDERVQWIAQNAKNIDTAHGPGTAARWMKDAQEKGLTGEINRPKTKESEESVGSYNSMVEMALSAQLDDSGKIEKEFQKKYKMSSQEAMLTTPAEVGGHNYVNKDDLVAMTLATNNNAADTQLLLQNRNKHLHEKHLGRKKDIKGGEAPPPEEYDEMEKSMDGMRTQAAFKLFKGYMDGLNDRLARETGQPITPEEGGRAYQILMAASRAQRPVRPEDLYTQIVSVRSQSKSKTQANVAERQRIENEANWKFGQEGY